MFNKYILTIALCLSYFRCVISKVLIITHAYLRPDFIEIQYKTFKKFLTDEYEFVVFNDARNSHIRQQVNTTCQKLHIRCIEIPQAIHDKPYLQRNPGEDFNNPCARCANVVQYSLDMLGFKHDDIVAIVDSDLFLVKEFSIVNYMKDYDIAGLLQSRGNIDYLWNGIAFFNMNSLPDKETINFNCGFINNTATDVGGFIYYYFKNHPQIRIAYVNQHHSGYFACDVCQQYDAYTPCIHNANTWKKQGIPEKIINFMQKGPNNVEFFIDHTFLHYRGGGNWDQKSPEYHAQKTKILNDFIEEILL